MKKIEFEEMRQLQYELLLELDKVCKENGLTYLLAYGSLLGAVRHGGFIPWDDDVDVIMPMSDIDKLEQIYHSEKYSVVTCYNNKEHAFPFARLYDNRTCTRCGKYTMLGIGIDIYPVVNVPQDVRDKFIESVFKFVPRRQFLIKLRKFLAKSGLWMGKTMSFNLLNHQCKKMLECVRQYDMTDADSVFICSGERHIIKKDLLFPPSEVLFNNERFVSPNNCHELLSVWYGDYMQLPPVEQRKPYHSGDYYWK